MGKRTNEEGERMSPIYDGDGLLTSITMNCDELLRSKLDAEQRVLVDGIRHMVSELLKNDDLLFCDKCGRPMREIAARDNQDDTLGFCTRCVERGGTDRDALIQGLHNGDEVYWADPGDGLASGHYKVVDVADAVGERCEETIVYIRNEAGSEAEVPMRELT